MRKFWFTVPVAVSYCTHTNRCYDRWHTTFWCDIVSHNSGARYITLWLHILFTHYSRSLALHWQWHSTRETVSVKRTGDTVKQFVPSATSVLATRTDYISASTNILHLHDKLVALYKYSYSKQLTISSANTNTSNKIWRNKQVLVTLPHNSRLSYIILMVNIAIHFAITSV